MAAVSRADVVGALENTVWRASGWKVRQGDVDALMRVVDLYANGEDVQALEPVPVVDTEAVYKAGIQEGERRASERPSASLTPLPEATTPGQGYRAADGGVWLFLGAAEQIVLPQPEPAPVTEEEQSAPEVVLAPVVRELPPVDDTRRCRVCHRVKPLATAFRLAARSAERRRLDCRECEARARGRRKREVAA